MIVLIADDHEVVRDGLAQLVRDAWGTSVFLLAGDGREAIQQASKFTIDLIILDLCMPQGMGGLEALPQLRKLQPEAKIVIFSMHEEEHYLLQTLQDGADGYLLKRFKTITLVLSLQEILRGKKLFLDQVISEKQGKTPGLQLPISTREKEVFILTALGYSLQNIADRLQISVRTVENHRRNISRKLNTKKRSDWLEIAKNHQLLDLYV